MAAVVTDPQLGSVSGDSVTVVFDCTDSEMHDHVSTITDHPVEEGFNPTDHARNEPDKPQVVITISDTPLGTARDRARRSGATGNSSSNGYSAPGYSRAQYAKLKKLKEDHSIVTLLTSLGQYDSLMIERLSAPRSKDNGNALEATIAFKRVVVVRNQLTRRVKSKDKRVAKPRDKGDKGNQQTDVEESTLSSGYDKGGAAKQNSAGGKIGATLKGIVGL